MSRAITLPLVALALALGLVALDRPAIAERAIAIPVAKLDPPVAAPEAVAVFAGGCFWGMEGVFEHVKGVRDVVSGYAGGTANTARYDVVSSETTRHAEAIRIRYDPRVISYATLLRVYFSVAHDPTQVNRQGPDSGTSYRSAIFAQTPVQAQVARAYIAQLNASGKFAAPIATRLEGGQFYAAEAYHQDFMKRNPQHPYITRWDVPKLAAFRAGFPSLAR